MIRRNAEGFGGAGLNPDLLARIKTASAVLSEKQRERPMDKNAILKQILENNGNKPVSKYSAADSPTTTSGYLLLLLSSVFLLTGWLGSWTNGGGPTTPSPTTTLQPETTTSRPPTNRIWKYECDYGYQGRQCDECGVQKVKPNIKIVGGIDAVPHSWPFQIVLANSYSAELFDPKSNKTFRYSDINSFGCGGSLITRDTVLTAAHCFDKPFSSFQAFTPSFNILPYTKQFNQEYPTLESRYSVYLGVNNITEKDEDPNVVRVPVAFIALHPEYNLDGRTFNDIAIIKLAWEVELNDNIQLACLPDPNIPDYPQNTGLEAYAMGYGALDEITQSLPDVLQNVLLETLDGPTECTAYQNGFNDWNTQICAGYLPGGKDTCQGDSGGPLYVKDYVPVNQNKKNGKNGKASETVQKYVQVGVVSYGTGCARPGIPGIYTKVSAYYDWIVQYL